LKKDRSLYENTRLHHHYFKRKGSYRFAAKNMLRLIFGLVILGLGIGLINHYLIDIDEVMEGLFQNFSTPAVLLVFFISEAILGLLPPDLFIYWTRIWESPWLGISLLGISSYAGELIAYWLGAKIGHIPRVAKWLSTKFALQIVSLRRYGGLLIFLAALTPLPFSPVSLISGMIQYGFKSYAIMALSRIARFFLYALVLYQI